MVAARKAASGGLKHHLQKMRADDVLDEVVVRQATRWLETCRDLLRIRMSCVAARKVAPGGLKQALLTASQSSCRIAARKAVPGGLK